MLTVLVQAEGQLQQEQLAEAAAEELLAQEEQAKARAAAKTAKKQKQKAKKQQSKQQQPQLQHQAPAKQKQNQEAERQPCIAAPEDELAADVSSLISQADGCSKAELASLTEEDEGVRSAATEEAHDTFLQRVLRCPLTQVHHACPV